MNAKEHKIRCDILEKIFRATRPMKTPLRLEKDEDTSVTTAFDADGKPVAMFGENFEKALKEMK